jgi:DNA ligase-1
MSSLQASQITALVDLLAMTSKKTEKLAIINGFVGSGNSVALVDFDRFLMFVYDEVRYTYGRTNIDPIVEEYKGTTGIGVGLEKVFSLFENISSDGIRGHRSDHLIRMVYSAANNDERRVIKMIFERDLRCGCGISTFNSSDRGVVVAEHPYQRMSSFSEKKLKKLKDRKIAQLKADGKYVDIIVYHNTVQVFSRNGKPCDGLLTADEVEQLLEKHKNTVIQGEALVLSDDGTGVMDRQTGNGYLNQKPEDIDSTRVVFSVWNQIPLDSFFAGSDDTPYSQIWDDLVHQMTAGQYPSSFSLIKYVDCVNFTQLADFFNEVRLAGEEGLIVKDPNEVWKNGTSGKHMKMKVAVDGEVKVIGIKEGKGKYAGMVGSLECVTTCGTVHFFCAGITDKQRKEWFKNPELIVDKIITVRYNDVVYDERTGMYALYLPRFVEIRTDRDFADSRERLVEQVTAFVDLIQLMD